MVLQRGNKWTRALVLQEHTVWEIIEDNYIQRRDEIV